MLVYSNFEYFCIWNCTAITKYKNIHQFRIKRSFSFISIVRSKNKINIRVINIVSKILSVSFQKFFIFFNLFQRQKLIFFIFFHYFFIILSYFSYFFIIFTSFYHISSYFHHFIIFYLFFHHFFIIFSYFSYYSTSYTSKYNFINFKNNEIFKQTSIMFQFQ